MSRPTKPGMLFSRYKPLFSTQWVTNLPKPSAHMSPLLIAGTYCYAVPRGSEDFRVLVRNSYYFDKSGDGDPNGPDAPLRGTRRDIELRKAWNEFKMGTPNENKEGYMEQKMKIHAYKKGAKINGAQVLRWTLHHGGALFMFGDTIQHYFDHSITPHTVRMGQIIRFIDPVGGEPELIRNNVLVDRGHGPKIAAWLKRWKEETGYTESDPMEVEEEPEFDDSGDEGPENEEDNEDE